jgi:hypothetical protein
MEYRYGSADVPLWADPLSINANMTFDSGLARLNQPNDAILADEPIIVEVTRADK